MSPPLDEIKLAAEQSPEHISSDVAQVLTRRLQAAIKRELAAAQSEDPRCIGFSVKQDIFAYPKRPRGWSGVPLRVIKGFVTTRTFLTKTNKQIADHVGTWFPGHAVGVSIMTKPLPRSVRAQIQVELGRAGLPIEVRDGDTLSTLKRAIRAGGRDAIPSAGKIEVAMGDGYVVINGQELKVETGRGTDTVRVCANGKRQHLRVDVLRALMMI